MLIPWLLSCSSACCSRYSDTTAIAPFAFSISAISFILENEEREGGTSRLPIEQVRTIEEYGLLNIRILLSYQSRKPFRLRLIVLLSCLCIIAGNTSINWLTLLIKVPEGIGSHPSFRRSYLIIIHQFSHSALSKPSG